MKDMDKEKNGELMMRIIEELVWRIMLEDMEMINEDEEVGKMKGKENLVSKEDNSNELGRKDKNSIKKLIENLRIERRGRIIEKNEFRVNEKRERNRKKMMMEEGKMERIFVGMLRDIKKIKIMNGDLLRMIFRNIEKKDRRKSEVLKNGQMREEVEVMEKNEELEEKLIDFIKIVGKIDKIEEDIEFMMLLKKVDEEDNGRFERKGR